MTVIVFSKDRAMQLDAFLQSWRDHLIPRLQVHVLCVASTARHQAAYTEVFALHEFASRISQSNFKAELLYLVPQTGNVVFFVDDQVFIRPWRVYEKPGLSLHLAPHLTWCYPFNVEQPLPSFQEEELDVLSWIWADGQWDWAYPLSVDGHVFDAEEFRAIVASLTFHSPNTLEAKLQQFLPRFLPRRGYCYTEAKVVNIPWTRVQDEMPNRFAGRTIEGMLMLWETGSRIDVQRLYGIRNESAHQEFPLILRDRVAYEKSPDYV